MRFVAFKVPCDRLGRYAVVAADGPGTAREVIAIDIRRKDTAELLAAAPDMLDALEGIVGFLTSYPHPYGTDISGFMDAAERAIRQARGE